MTEAVKESMQKIDLDWERETYGTFGPDAQALITDIADHAEVSWPVLSCSNLEAHREY